MSEYSEMINKQFDEEIICFKENPPSACVHKTALKLLREFERDSIDFSAKFLILAVGRDFIFLSQTFGNVRFIAYFCALFLG